MKLLMNLNYGNLCISCGLSAAQALGRVPVPVQDRLLIEIN
jgi:hypothetical protein